MNEHDDELEHIHRVRYSTRERLAGLFILVAAVLLLAAFVFSRQLTFLLADTFPLHAHVDDAEGIDRNTVVTLAGFEVGRVNGIEWTDDNRIRLDLEIRERFHEQIREDSRASISMALVGDPGIEISRGSREQPVLPAGAEIAVTEPLSIEQLMDLAAPAIEDAAATLEQVNNIVSAIDPAAIAQITEELAMTLAEVRQLGAGVEEGSGIVGRLFKDESLADSIQANTEQLAGVLEETRERLADLEPVIVNAEDIAAELPELIEESAQLAQAASAQLEDMEAGGEVADILVQLRSVLAETERTLRGIQNVWPIAPNVPESPTEDALPPQPPNN